MKHSDKSTFSLRQVMMSLSAVAYIPFHSINMLQDNLHDADALERDYAAIWWAKDDFTVVFLVKNKFTNEYALIFRGPVFRPGLSFLVNLYEELGLGRQDLLACSRLGDARMASGVVTAIERLHHATYSGRPLHQVLNNLPLRTRVYMAGHSLGGSLAAVYAAKTACSNSVDLDIVAFTFGSPAIGNESFAKLFDPGNANRLFMESSHCVNSLDILPYAWNDLQGMLTVDYGKVRPSAEFNLCVEWAEKLLGLSKVMYVQPPPEIQLNGGAGGNDTFFTEAMHQHQPNTYLQLLGLDPIAHTDFCPDERSEFILADSL
jgi:hypothetical protein